MSVAAMKMSAGLEPRRIYLHPGQMLVSSQPTIVTTILGSCVAVCLWEPTLQIGGINHFLLPTGDKDPRYGTEAMHRLLDEMSRRNALTRHVTAKIFGGACVLADFSRQSIGAQNVAVARESLAKRRIQIVSEQIEGTHGRKLHFDFATGEVRVKEL